MIWLTQPTKPLQMFWDILALYLIILNSITVSDNDFRRELKPQMG